jgi:uncharacterized membrane protein YgcG
MRSKVCIALTSLIFSCILVLQPDAVSAYSNVASQVTATSAPGSATVTLKWGAASNATRYEARVRIGSSSGIIFRSSGTIGSTGRTFSFTGVEYNLKYVVGVRAGDADSWGAFVYADPVVPEAADPNPPAKPDISSPADGQITINWSAPGYTGGAAITNYIVQLFIGDVVSRAPVTTSGLTYTFKDLTSTSKYSVNVKAVNAESKTSEPSELSDAKTPSKDVAAVLAAPARNNSPSSGGSGNPSSGGSGTPSSGGSNSPSSSGGGNSPAVVPTPVVDQGTRTVSPTPATPRYTKVIKAKATTSSKTLLSLSKLPAPKGSKTSLTVASSSRKFCQVKGTSVKNLKRGTCSVKVTVTTKSGKKTSRTVKLVVR